MKTIDCISPGQEHYEEYDEGWAHGFRDAYADDMSSKERCRLLTLQVSTSPYEEAGLYDRGYLDGFSAGLRG